MALKLSISKFSVVQSVNQNQIKYPLIKNVKNKKHVRKGKFGVLRIVCREYQDISKLPNDDYDWQPDAIKEYNRTLMGRQVFTHEVWASHRSTERYWKHLTGLFRSRIQLGLLKPVGFLTAIATVIATYESLLEAKILPPSMYLPLDAPSDPFNLTSFALALLLVFRTDASYARWEQAQQAWEEIGKSCTCLVREGCAWLNEKQLQKRLGDWVCVYVHCVMAELREGIDLEYQIQDKLAQQEINLLMRTSDRPSMVLQTISQYLKVGLSTKTREHTCHMNEHLRHLEDSTTRARRLLIAPLPLSYTRHTSRFIIIWLALLPFSLWHELRWFMVPATTITALMMLGIEEIGVQVEEPFGILPLEHYCNLIERGVSQLLNQREVIKEVVDDTQLLQNVVQYDVWGLSSNIDK